MITRAALAWVIGGVRNPFLRIYQHAKMMAELQLVAEQLRRQAAATLGGEGPGQGGQ